MFVRTPYSIFYTQGTMQRVTDNVLLKSRHERNRDGESRKIKKDS